MLIKTLREDMHNRTAFFASQLANFMVYMSAMQTYFYRSP